MISPGSGNEHLLRNRTEGEAPGNRNVRQGKWETNSGSSRKSSMQKAQRHHQLQLPQKVLRAHWTGKELVHSVPTEKGKSGKQGTGNIQNLKA